MITKQNFKEVLTKLKFEEIRENYFSKYFKVFECRLEVDIENEKLIFPEDKWLTINDRTTSNFRVPENFVVFECINRLLEQWYNPKHIELEPKWQLWHWASWWKADILVKDNSWNSLLIIECKTSWTEFNNAWKQTLTKPTQIFSYAQQERTTEFISLYASDFLDNKVISNYYLINLKDNNDLLKNNPKLKSFKDASSVEEIYQVWFETYSKEYATLWLFENNRAYEIGKNKYSINDLKNVSSKDIAWKYHEFATIMRQHNVGTRERSFDNLVNLFLCKVIDETSNPNNLSFYWKWKAFDNAFDLQDRLLKLYKEWMEKFLNDKIVYVDNWDIDKAFRVFKDKPNSTKDIIKNLLKQQKFFTNSAFSFIDVHNEELFYKNFEVLLKVLQMFQDIKLVGWEENQFLWDMFEWFLDQWVKQSEWQYFTPMPIVKFVINSLPEIKNPLAIDYACWAGHFLNEYASQNPSSQVIWIEKEYRLSKVSKVSAFMYWNDDVKIIYDDALATNKEIKNNSFDVLVANPPYSVKWFLETLNEEGRNNFELIKNIDKKSYSSNNSIECFFIEKASQILKDWWVAWIIVPSSILNKANKVYSKTREIILKSFSIIAIYESGSWTFWKTGTNTVTLFLKKKETSPTFAEHFENMVNIWFEWDLETNENELKYSEVLQKYCSHMEYNFEDYKSFLKNNNVRNDCIVTDNFVQNNEVFKEYKTAFEKESSTKSLKNTRNFKSLSKIEQEKELWKEFIKYAKNIEKDKLLYFWIANDNENNVLIIKTPAWNNEIKKFLGYEWSSWKWNEWIKYLTSQKVNIEDEENELDEEDKRVLENISSLNNIETPLYNPKDLNDESKINTLIKKNFENKSFKIPENLTEFVKTSKLINMLDFSRVSFDKAISLNPNRNIDILTKYKKEKIWDLILESPKSKIQVWEAKEIKNWKYPFFTSWENIYFYNNYLVQWENIYLSTWWNAVVKYYKWQASYSTDTYAIKSNNENIILTSFIFIILESIVKEINNLLFEWVWLKHLQKDLFRNIKIPLPPLEIQKQIVWECEKVDEEVKKAENEIFESKKEIGNIIWSLKYKKEKIWSLNNLLKRWKSTKYWNSNIQVIKSWQARWFKEFDFKEKFYAIDWFILDERKLQKWDLLINSTWVWTAGRVTLFQLEWDFVSDSHITIFRPNEKILDSNFALQCFIDIWFKTIEKMAKGSTGQIELNLDVISQIEIPLPSLEIQKEIVSQIEIIEQKIDENKKILESGKDRKKEVLKKFL